MKFVVLLVVCVGLIAHHVDGDECGQPKPKRVFTHRLPGLAKAPTFKMFSGYLNGTTDNNKLFYWLNEAHDDLDSTTLVVTFQGGPGCSSLFSLFKENGPYILNDETGTLEPNEFSWNRKWHTAYIEAPLDTGFSYSEESQRERSNDINAAEEMYAALEYFIDTLHPKYRDFDIFVAGESYAGIFLPTLATIIKNNESSTVNRQFRGIILGNPLLKRELKPKSIPIYAHRHGLISSETYAAYEQDNCFTPNAGQACRNSRAILQSTLFRGKIDPSNYAKPCFQEVKPEGMKINPFLLTPAQRQKILNTENKCLDGRPLIAYLNDAAVKSAIHAKKSITWNICSAKVVFEHNRTLRDMTGSIKNITEEWGKSVLLYYGENDIKDNHISGEMFVNELGMTKLGPRDVFTIKDDRNRIAAGGMLEKYQKLQYAIVFNAGHMAVKDKPREVLQLVESFIESTLN